MNTITVTFPQVKVNLNINELNFNTLENMVFDMSQQIGVNQRVIMYQLSA